jgi:hypothetical protein
VKLTKAEREAFRSQMWAFRRDPESVTAEEQQALAGLFEKIPALKELYQPRLRSSWPILPPELGLSPKNPGNS